MLLSALLEPTIDESSVLPDQSYHSYHEVKENGPPAQPLDFPTPIVHDAKFVHVRAMDHRKGTVYEVNVLTRSCVSDRKIGYLVKKKIANTSYGCIRLCVILRQRRHSRFYDDVMEKAEWISTDEFVAVKVSSWTKMRHRNETHLKDPIKEAAALQFVGNYHPNILGSLETLQDSDYLYIVMPYCSGGTLYSYIRNEIHISDHRTIVEKNYLNIDDNRKPPARKSLDNETVRTTSTHSTSTVFDIPCDESQARNWFRQLLDAIVHLQKKGICHRSLCLENILLENNNNDLVIIDFSTALRVPFQDPHNYGGISDVSEGSNRLLIFKEQGQGKLFPYMDPVMYESENPAFDGYAADLWSAGVLLFIFLVGLEPLKISKRTDNNCFSNIIERKLTELTKNNLADATISNEVYDLLRNMLWRDPSKRLTLAQVMEHPWVVEAPKENPLNIFFDQQQQPVLEKTSTVSSAFRAYIRKGFNNNELVPT